jgi:protein phosphatase
MQTASIDVGPDYTGPRLVWPLKLANVLEMLELFKKGEVLHHKYVLEILKEAIRILAPLPTLQEITLKEGEKLTVVGDLHGQLQDLFSIFSINGLPTAQNKYLFNGDFVDRGHFGTEVVVTLLAFKLLYPTGVFLNRGNHESRNQNSWMGFEDEIWTKYSGVLENDSERPVQVFERFQSLFECLPLCAVLQGKIFVVHGGLFSRDNVTLAHLKAISRKREPPLHQSGFEDKIYEDMLWSDPRPISTRQPSERGAGVEFGVDVTNNFCLVNRIALVIRSHECVPEGFEILHGGRLITLFSASRYCGTQMNKGAFLTLGPDLQPEIQQFYAHAIDENTFKTSELQDALEDDTLRMIAERICDHRPSLFWYFTQHDQEHNGFVSRLVWVDALKSVLQLDLPFLLYQSKLADVDDATGRINYSQFLARYRIENDLVDASGWQETMISAICKKLYRAMGAGNLEQAFKVFDADSNGFIEYEEFMSTLKKMDTGLSDQQIFELMRTADTNDDGRIDFNEFAQRFEVIFTDLRQATASPRSTASQSIDAGSLPPQSPSAGASAIPPPSPSSVEGASTSLPRPPTSKLVRRYSSREDHSFSAPAATHLDVETMDALLHIGRALFSREGSLHYHFYHFDTNQDGVLQRGEFEHALKQLGFDFAPDLMDRVMAAVDTDGGNSIDYKEFVTAFAVQDAKEKEMLERGGDLTWQHAVLQQVSNVFYQHRIHIRNAFRMFDATNTGFITKDEFRAGMSAFNAVLNSPLTDEQIEQLLAHLDSDGDGVVSYKEFFDGFRVVDVRVGDESANGDGTLAV